MFTAERIALLLLAVAIVVWAIVVYIDKNKGPASLPEIEVRMDSVEISNSIVNVGETTKGDTAKEKSKDKKRKSKKGKSGKSKEKVAKPPVKHRDHLREPVQE